MSKKHRNGCIVTILALVVVIAGISPSVQAESLCGTYAAAPGSTVEYEYIPGGANVVVLPLVAGLTFSCDSPTTMLEARLDSPIIGVDENGNVIFPIGGQFPMTVAGQSIDGRRFHGSLLEMPYLFLWDFDRRPSGNLSWSGSVDWAGGRYEHTSISNVELSPVPEPSGNILMWLGAMVVGRRRCILNRVRLFPTKSPKRDA